MGDCSALSSCTATDCEDPRTTPTFHRPLPDLSHLAVRAQLGRRSAGGGMSSKVLDLASSWGTSESGREKIRAMDDSVEQATSMTSLCTGSEDAVCSQSPST